MHELHSNYTKENYTKEQDKSSTPKGVGADAPASDKQREHVKQLLNDWLQSANNLYGKFTFDNETVVAPLIGSVD